MVKSPRSNLGPVPVKSIKAIVTGRVQGVWFRGSTQAEALRLGLVGHAKNLADGSVEVLAQGENSAVDELLTWLKHGPDLARVDHVASHSENIRGDLMGFQTL